MSEPELDAVDPRLNLLLAAVFNCISSNPFPLLVYKILGFATEEYDVFDEVTLLVAENVSESIDDE